MAEIVLTPTSPLGGYARDFGAIRLVEATGLALVGAAIPQGAEARAQEALRTVYGTAMAAPGRATISSDGATRILHVAPDQLWLHFARDAPDAVSLVAPALAGAFWLTDLSDAFATLDLSGPGAGDALARLCPLDLDPGIFGPDRCARTLIEHLSVTILRTGPQAFRLLSARSSAHSFLQALETALAAA